MPVSESIGYDRKQRCIAQKVSDCHLTVRLDLYKLNSVLPVTYFTAARLQNTVFRHKTSDAIKADKTNGILGEKGIQCERERKRGI